MHLHRGRTSEKGDMKIPLLLIKTDILINYEEFYLTLKQHALKVRVQQKVLVFEKFNTYLHFTEIVNIFDNIFDIPIRDCPTTSCQNILMSYKINNIYENELFF